MEHFNQFKTKCDARLDKYEILKTAEENTGVEKFYLTAAASALAVGILYAIGGSILIVNLVGFLYPAYMSFKALNTPEPEDDTQWLTYWVVYAFLNLTEQMTSFFVNWIPFYFLMKVAFLIWCYLPSTLGANVIYKSFLKPQLEKHLNCIDAKLNPPKKN